MAHDREHNAGRSSAEEQRGSPAALGYLGEPAPWERRLSESPKAYAAFCVFRDQGVQRSYVGTARALHRYESQIRRWAERYQWRERAHAWDVAQSRETELLVRQERERQARRRLRHAEAIERVAMAGLLQLVSRDPETGELQLQPEVTPSVLVRMYELALKITARLPSPQPREAAGGDTGDPLLPLADPEMEQVVALAKKRALGDQDEEDESDEQTHM